MDAALLALTAEVTVVGASAARADAAMAAAEEDLRVARSIAADQVRKRSALARLAELETTRSQVQSWRTALRPTGVRSPGSGDRRVAHSSQRGC